MYFLNSHDQTTLRHGRGVTNAQGFPCLFHNIYRSSAHLSSETRLVLSCAWLPGGMQRCVSLQFKYRLDHHVAPTRRPEIDIRYREHRVTSGTNNVKEIGAATNIAGTAKNVPGGPASVWGPPLLKYPGL